MGFFATFVLLRGHFCTNLEEALAPGLKLNLMTTLFYKKKLVLTKLFRVNDPPILAQKQQKKFDEETDFLGPKDPLEERVQHQTCSIICRTPVPSILNQQHSTGSAGGDKNSQNW